MSHEDDVEHYGDPGIASAHAPVPSWLIYNYIFWPLFGLFWLYLFFNGSWGFLDRGYWFQLQQAANTTFPQIENSEPQYPDPAGK